MLTGTPAEAKHPTPAFPRLSLRSRIFDPVNRSDLRNLERQWEDLIENKGGKARCVALHAGLMARPEKDSDAKIQLHH